MSRDPIYGMDHFDYTMLPPQEHEFCIEDGDDPSNLYALEITVKRIPYRSRPQESHDER